MTEAKEQSKSFSIFYDSDDALSPLVSHQMHLSDLTLALDGVRNLLATANSVLNGKDATLDVRVHAGFEPGSFGVLFDILSTPEAVKVLKYIGLSAGAGFFSKSMALEVIRGLKKRQIEIIEKQDDGSFALHVDGELIQCDKHAKRLVTNQSFRKAVDQIFTALSQVG